MKILLSQADQAIDFGVELVGQVRGQQITLRNDLPEEIRITDIQLEPYEYALPGGSSRVRAVRIFQPFDLPGLPLRIRPKSSLSFTLRYSPLFVGEQSARLVLLSGKDARATIQLYGAARYRDQGDLVYVNFGQPFAVPPNGTSTPKYVPQESPPRGLLQRPHFAMVVSAGDVPMDMHSPRVTVIPATSRETMWGAVPLRRAAGLHGALDCFQVFTVPYDVASGAKHIQQHQGTAGEPVLRAAMRNVRLYHSGIAPTSKSAGCLADFEKFSPHPDTLDRAGSRKCYNRWDVVLCRWSDGTLVPYVVISNAVVNERRPLYVITALPACELAPDEKVCGPPHDYYVEPEPGELGVSGRWAIMCHEPTSFDPRYQYAGGYPFVVADLTPKWLGYERACGRQGPTQNRIEAALADYYNLTALGESV